MKLLYSNEVFALRQKYFLKSKVFGREFERTLFQKGFSHYKNIQYKKSPCKLVAQPHKAVAHVDIFNLNVV